jgi:hypothetical protein
VALTVLASISIVGEETVHRLCPLLAAALVAFESLHCSAHGDTAAEHIHAESVAESARKGDTIAASTLLLRPPVQDPLFDLLSGIRTDHIGQ